jgi:translation initiation factor 2 beta subunit (eIF-2beta)/eIF-5
VTRLVCPHCGEYERYKLTATTGRITVYKCEKCGKWSEWQRYDADEPWRVREEKE